MIETMLHILSKDTEEKSAKKATKRMAKIRLKSPPWLSEQ
jgi:hypothetical protein